MSKEDKIDIIVKKEVVKKRIKIPNYTEEIEGQRRDQEGDLSNHEDIDSSENLEEVHEDGDDPSLENQDEDTDLDVAENLEDLNEGETPDDSENLEDGEDSDNSEEDEEVDSDTEKESHHEESPKEDTVEDQKEDDKNKDGPDQDKDGRDKSKAEELKGRKNLHPDRKRGEKKGKEAESNKEDKKDKDSSSGVGENDLSAKFEESRQLVMMAKAAIENTVNAIVNFVQLLLNPIFWIVLAALIVMAIVVATASVVGQNDYNIMCDASGIGSVSISPDADSFTRQSAIASWFTSTPFALTGGAPLSREQAAGIIGNMDKESYGANPRAIQGDSSLSQWAVTSNEDVLSWGEEGGKAIGIIQWDRGRRVALVNFAISEGTQWHDLNTQLKFLKSEMDSGYEREQLEAGGFNEPNKSVADYARIWNVWFERSAKSGTPDGDNPRIESAEAFASRYTGGDVGSLGTNCIGNRMGIDASNLVQLAIESAWPNRSQALGKCVGTTNCGQYFSTETYKQAKLAAEAATSKDPLAGLLASCDRFVATMYRATGQDPSFPWGDTDSQKAYMDSSLDWAQVSCQDRQPGDVLWRNRHVMLYVGHVNGKDSIASASFKERSASLSSVSCQGDLFVADGDTAIGYRKVK